jgi:isoleucyl-tRNA synthetase
MKEAAVMIAAMDHHQIEALEKAGQVEVTINGNPYSITPEDLIISTEDLPGWKTASEDGLTVALDVNLSEELISEGIARDIVNRIQNLRKEANFNITDRIEIRIQRDPAIERALRKFEPYIREETLADRIVLEDQLDGTEVELNDELAMIVSVDLV